MRTRLLIEWSSRVLQSLEPRLIGGCEDNLDGRLGDQVDNLYSHVLFLGQRKEETHSKG
jgi:hypothetical protein